MLLADRAYAEMEKWQFGKADKNRRAPLVTSLRSLARRTHCEPLDNIADLIQRGGATAKLPSTYVFGGESVWHHIYDDLVETVTSLRSSSPPPEESLERLDLAVRESSYYRARRLDMERLQRRFANAHRDRTNVEVFGQELSEFEIMDPDGCAQVLGKLAEWHEWPWHENPLDGIWAYTGDDIETWQERREQTNLLRNQLLADWEQLKKTLREAPASIGEGL